MFWSSNKKKKPKPAPVRANSPSDVLQGEFDQRKLEAKAAVQEINQRLGILDEQQRADLEKSAPLSKAKQEVPSLNRGGLGGSSPQSAAPADVSGGFNVKMPGVEPSNKNENGEKSGSKRKKEEILPLRRPF